MKIALDVSPLLDGASGIGYYVEKLCAALAAAAPDHELVFMAAFRKNPERLAAAALPKARNASLLHLSAPQSLLLPAEQAFGLAWRERRLLDLGVDVVHGLGNVLPPLKRLPGVVTLHHVDEVALPGAWNRFFFDALPRRSARDATAVIAVSESTRRAAIGLWGLDPGRVETVLEGGPDPLYRPAAPGSSAPAVPYVLHVGAMVARKNIPALMRAFARVVERDPGRPLRLVLAGRPGDASPEIARLAAAAPLAGRVEILGSVPRERLVGLYQGAAAAVVPSTLEGFGFPVLEAMACGAPVLAAAATSLPEVAGDAALLFDVARPAALEEGLSRILDDADFSAELRRRGPARAAAFSWETAAERTLEVLTRARAAGPKS